MDVFSNLAPYIQNYIYKNEWKELRGIQIAAFDVITNTDKNLLLSTGTASGKTEAAFLPALTELYNNPSKSVGILYISPLKALINDQFYRLDSLLEEGNVSVCKWHGDASITKKKKLIEKPEGVLQITPESLESLLINRKGECYSLFYDLRYIIIDEVHYFMSSPRGTQLICQLERIQRISNNVPRRIGLSATLSDYVSAENWLDSASGKECITPKVFEEPKKMRLFMQRFGLKDDESQNNLDSGRLAHYEFLYKSSLHKKTLLFAKSRAEVEMVIANIRKIALDNKTEDVYRVHHGSISATLREIAEKDMKTSDKPIVTGATVTLELGIDLGALDRVIQIGSPFSASSFVQRIGRCGRRGQAAELLFTFEDVETNGDKYSCGQINWNFIKTIAIIQLYLKEKWVEPIQQNRYQYSLLYHQTMSYMLSSGEVKAAHLAQNVLSLSAFNQISQEDYRELIQHLIKIEHIQKTERGGLIIGKKAENIVSHYSFYAVFEAVKEYDVINKSTVIGTVSTMFPEGERFALAGKTWECIKLNKESKKIYVKLINGVSKIRWMSLNQTDLHEKLVNKMKAILLEDTYYGYLSEECKLMLKKNRDIAVQASLLNKHLLKLGDGAFLLMPWLGTREMVKLHLSLQYVGIANSFQPYESMPLFLEIQWDGKLDELELKINEISKQMPDKYDIVAGKNLQLPNKYNKFIPKKLLEKQYVEDYLL